MTNSCGLEYEDVWGYVPVAVQGVRQQGRGRRTRTAHQSATCPHLLLMILTTVVRCHTVSPPSKVGEEERRRGKKEGNINSLLEEGRSSPLTCHPEAAHCGDVGLWQQGLRQAAGGQVCEVHQAAHQQRLRQHRALVVEDAWCVCTWGEGCVA